MGEEKLTESTDPERLGARLEAFKGCVKALEPLGALPPKDTQLVLRALWELYGNK